MTSEEAETLVRKAYEMAMGKMKKKFSEMEVTVTEKDQPKQLYLPKLSEKSQIIESYYVRICT